MGWPTPENYDEAVQNLHHSMSDEELRGGQAALDDQQLPMVWAGSFASVYHINCPATGTSWALKCFTREVKARQERYRHIAAHLQAVGLPFTVPFVYLERGIQVRGQWFPAVKMEWVEGQTLNRFVEESLDKPKMLQQLLDLWPKLAARLRDARIAHADLQHGNVLLVPAPDGKLALKLIDYDGMYVSSLADTPSGELGHANYQHPERLRRHAYNADVDRFSHLAIYTAVHCLKSAGQDLWRQFNNDDNLLFRETDFRQPGVSKVFRTVWELPDAAVRALAGRLILACGRPLDQTPLLDEMIVNGKVAPLSWKEESRVAETLAIGKARAAPAPEPATPDIHPATAEATNVGWALARLDGVLRRLVGQQNDLLRRFLWAALPLLLLVAVWAGFRALATSPVPLKLKPIAPQTVEVGKPLSVVVALENAEVWKGKVRYSLGSPTPLGMSIDAATGIFTWTPSGQTADKYDVTVLATGPDGRRDETSFVVNVLRPISPLRLQPISPQTVEAGRPLGVTATVENSAAWKGKLRYSLGPQSPAGMTINAETGELTWRPPSDKPARQYDVTISVAASDSLRDQRAFAITVTRPVLRGKEDLKGESVIDLGGGVKLEMVLIPPGEFLMGSPDAFDDEKPQHRVRITKPFYLGRYLVTQEQWEAVMGNNPSKFKGPKNPVEYVSWEDCQKFVEKLNGEVRGGRFLLPTEAQWEYACRAGSTTRYCFGDEESGLGEYAWYNGNSRSTMHPVGEKKPNAWGLYDMHGNVWEWCQDWYDEGYYANSPTDDPTGPSVGSHRPVGGPHRMFRGGSWSCPAYICRSANRSCNEAGARDSWGLRVSLVLAGKPGGETVLAESTATPTKVPDLSPADAWKTKAERFARDHLGRFIDDAPLIDGRAEIPLNILPPAPAGTAWFLGNGRIYVDNSTYSFGDGFEKDLPAVRHEIPALAANLHLKSAFVELHPQGNVLQLAVGGVAAGPPGESETDKKALMADLARRINRLITELRTYHGTKTPDGRNDEAFKAIIELAQIKFPQVPPRPDSSNPKYKDRPDVYDSDVQAYRNAVAQNGAMYAAVLEIGNRKLREYMNAMDSLRKESRQAVSQAPHENDQPLAALKQRCRSISALIYQPTLRRGGPAPTADTPSGPAERPGVLRSSQTGRPAAPASPPATAENVPGKEDVPGTDTSLATLSGKEIAVDLGSSIKLELVLIPAGEFLMGSPDSDMDARSDEKPQHRVRITKPFYLGKYLVTEEQWVAVMGRTPSGCTRKNIRPQYPVGVWTWKDCHPFLAKLNANSGDGRGRFQLPTEAQWEYACRAGSTTRYCHGDDESRLPQYAWYSANSGSPTRAVGEKKPDAWAAPGLAAPGLGKSYIIATREVGRRKPNAWGLCDMHGNLRECCRDWYGRGYYANSPTDDPTGPAMGSFRVFRGGCWGDPAWCCRSANRFNGKPGADDASLGLRVCLVPADK